jgi:pyruvate/2-oxoglutarate dehydrogenase complex dihydrolipoamide dehydrogenase (E3) component
VENIFAIGDIKSGGLELTPVAIKEGEYVVEGIVNNKW